MFSRRTVGWVILGYTLASWGGRIGLLTAADAADIWSWVRIGGSIAVGVATWLAFISSRWVVPIGWFFAGFTTLVWVRSLITVWTDPANSLGFSVVHSVLAALWFAVAALAVGVAQTTGSGTPDPTTGVPGATSSDSASTTSSIDR